jgi:tight adherence protein C
MPIVALALAAVAAGAILMIFMAITGGSSEQRVQARLNQFGAGQVQTLEEIELQEPFLERSVLPILRRLSGSANRLGSATFTTATGKRLVIAGLSDNITAGDWLALKVMVAGLVAGGLVVLSVILRGSLSITLIAGLVGIGIGYVAPEWWLSSRVRDRQKRIQKALPDTLDLLSISVRAGLGFDAALQQSVQSTPGPLSMEFDRALAEIRMGKQRREAMRAIVPRTEVKPLTNFIGAILQAEQLGVPIARVLQIQSEQLRMERRQRAEANAAKAPIKMLIPLVGCILPALFVVILGPAIILISTSLPS